MRRSRTTRRLPAVLLAGLVAGCTGSTTGGLPPTSTTTRTATTTNGKLACDLVTPDVIRAAHFTLPVTRQTKSTGLGKNGASKCTFGDDPDPANLSANYLALLIMTPASLNALHTTAKAEAKAVASPCPAPDVRELGSAGGIGSYAYFCVKQADAPAGGWLQGGKVYLLEVGSPKVVYGTTSERLTQFEAVAKAIAKNAGS